ncbi:phosphoribosyltransferase [Streptomyces sulphureus]|uniref:phosphoribosyltransferase n=1 Tax=Streptomyces sulphureus TaxID=47758 RepID=UPI0003816226
MNGEYGTVVQADERDDGPAPARGAWSGEWVERELGVRIGGEGLRELVGLALRRNPKRAHLLVSRVLGKHVPQRPSVVLGAGRTLGRRVRTLLGEAADRATVLGYAETATGLGHAVADGLGAAYLHSTRRRVPGVAPFGGFEEEHSHATGHLLLPEDPSLLLAEGPLVLVDDEFSTGRTARNTLAALHRRQPRERYVLVSLVDVRTTEDQAALREFAASLGTRVDVVSLAAGRVTLPGDVLERGERLVAAHAPPAVEPRPGPEFTRVDLGWPAGLAEGARHGVGRAHASRLDAVLPGVAARLAARLAPARPARVLVLGTEELMYAPLRIAHALEEHLGESAEVRFSTTTRSPVLPVDDDGYAIRTALTFTPHDLPPGSPDSGTRYAYNVAGGGFDAVVALVDDVGDTEALRAPDGLLAQLAPHTERLLLGVLPTHVPTGAPAGRPLRGPLFSSYRAEDVGWLLRDFSDVELEAPTEEREEAIQSGGAHYAESLPVEYQPSPRYRQLFHSALDHSASRLARAVGAVTETVLAERGPSPVLVSLARAGTPVGVLMRRWALRMHGVALSHYAVSIVRGRGIDEAALRYLAAHHDPGDVVFVDGWTGKGAITRELADAVAAHPGFDPSLAVLADPGSCVRTYGTREDFLIPSACLNSTVSGLISRTVLRDDLVGPGDFHGAKFYRELAADDVSQLFLDRVEGHFPEVREDAAADSAALRATDRTPTWEGWRAVDRISEEYGIGDVNLVKPGVGETTRVLLRRVPWRVLARRGAGADLDHVRLLAEQRGVPVEEVDGLPYAAVGLVHPRYTRGATGADGRAADSGAPAARGDGAP